MQDVIDKPAETFVQVSEVWVPQGDRLVLEKGNYGRLDAFAAASTRESFAKGEGLPGKAWAEARPAPRAAPIPRIPPSRPIWRRRKRPTASLACWCRRWQRAARQASPLSPCSAATIYRKTACCCAAVWSISPEG